MAATATAIAAGPGERPLVEETIRECPAYGADFNAAGIDVGPLVASNTGGPTSAQDLVGLFLSLPPAEPLLQTGVVSSSSSYSRGTGTTASAASVADPQLHGDRGERHRPLRRRDGRTDHGQQQRRLERGGRHPAGHRRGRDSRHA